MTQALRGLHLHFDCASGIAGDMTLGALLDLGVPIEVVGDALDQVGAGRWRLSAERCVRGSVAAMNVTVSTAGALEGRGAGQGEHAHDHGGPSHSHDHGAHSHDHGAHSHEHGAPSHDHGAPSHDHDHGTHVPSHSHEHGAHSHDHGAHSHGHGTHSHDHDAPSHLPSRDHDHASPSPSRDPGEPRHGDHGHSHPHGDGGGHHHHRYQAIRARIAESGLAADVKALSLDIFDRLARAEARLHGKTVESVEFHEVGAIDSIVDIVGTAAAWCYLAPASATCAQVAMGHGTLRCAHGLLPVPAPAALEILRDAGGVMTEGNCPRELCTPTGAAILAATVTRWTPMPAGRPVAIGWGAGDLELADRPNVLRLTAIAPTGAESVDRPAASLWQIEANIDDMSPELCNVALEAAFAAGAVDVWWTPITMKKGRPALWLCALASEEHREAVMRAILRETTTIGLRCSRRERRVLERRFATVETPYGPLPIKLAYDGEVLMNAAPELEPCRTAAQLHQVPVKEVMAAVTAAWLQTAGARVIG